MLFIVYIFFLFQEVSMLTLKGRTVVSVGLGAAGAMELMAEGMNVVMFTHSPDLQRAYEEEMGRTLGRDFVHEHLMVFGEGWVDKDDRCILGLEESYKRFGSVDCVVAFTGGPGKIQSIEEITVEDINTNVPYLTASAFNFTKHALPYLRQSKAGRVVYFTTTEAQTGGMNSGMVDSIARGAVLSLTYNMARRLAPDKITVNAISVGPFDKKMSSWTNEPNKPDPYQIVDQVPLKRVATQQDVAYALHYLLSEEADFITGQVINLNGGLFMG